jgi:hypothetical protein
VRPWREARVRANMARAVDCVALSLAMGFALARRRMIPSLSRVARLVGIGVAAIVHRHSSQTRSTMFGYRRGFVQPSARIGVLRSAGARADHRPSGFDGVPGPPFACFMGIGETGDRFSLGRGRHHFRATPLRRGGFERRVRRKPLRLDFRGLRRREPLGFGCLKAAKLRLPVMDDRAFDRVLAEELCGRNRASC